MHLDMDTFFVSVERLLDPSLIGKPVIVGGKPFERGVVAGCSREARAYGIHSAMPLRRAYQLCPDAVFLYGRHGHYSRYSDYVTYLIEEQVPRCEKASIDEFYLDIGGCGLVFDDEKEWAARLRRRILDETGLPCTYGIARNKTVAKIATNVGKKRGECIHVAEGEEEEFLASVPIREMPGIGEVTETTLRGMRIHTIGDLARMPSRILYELFGKHGTSLYERARGIDRTPFTIGEKQKSCGAEHTFREDVNEMETFLNTLRYLAARVGKDLRDKGFKAKTITLKVRDYKFNTITRASHCEHTNADHTIYNIAEAAFLRVYEEGTPLRLLGISTSHFVEDYDQMGMFNEDLQRKERLYAGLDEIRMRFGKHAVVYGSAFEMV